MTEPTRTLPPDPAGITGRRDATQLTVAFEPRTGEPVGRFRVVLGGTAGTADSAELCEQLRERLRFIASVAAIGEGIETIVRTAILRAELLSMISERPERFINYSSGIVMTLVECWAVIQLAGRRGRAYVSQLAHNSIAAEHII